MSPKFGTADTNEEPNEQSTIHDAHNCGANATPNSTSPSYTQTSWSLASSPVIKKQRQANKNNTLQDKYQPNTNDNTIGPIANSEEA
jgi:hypothetical protein